MVSTAVIVPLGVRVQILQPLGQARRLVVGRDQVHVFIFRLDDKISGLWKLPNGNNKGAVKVERLRERNVLPEHGVLENAVAYLSLIHILRKVFWIKKLLLATSKNAAVFCSASGNIIQACLLPTSERISE